MLLFDIFRRLSVQVEMKGRTVSVEARVIYSSRTNTGPHQEPGMGLEFVKISPQDQLIVRQFLRDEITSNG